MSTGYVQKVISAIHPWRDSSSELPMKNASEPEITAKLTKMMAPRVPEMENTMR